MKLKQMLALLVILSLGCVGLSAKAEQVADKKDSRIYLVIKLSLEDNTLNHIVLKYSKDVKDIKKCKKDIYFGSSKGKWQYYSQLVRSKGGGFVNYSVNYFCAHSHETFPRFKGSNFLATNVETVVRVDLTSDDEFMKLKPFDSYAECLADVRSSHEEEKHDYFCAYFEQGNAFREKYKQQNPE